MRFIWSKLSEWLNARGAVDYLKDFRQNLNISLYACRLLRFFSRKLNANFANDRNVSSAEDLNPTSCSFNTFCSALWLMQLKAMLLRKLSVSRGHFSIFVH